MKKVLATVLALVMALALCSVSWADVVEVKTEAELTNAVSSGGEIKLGADITLTSMLTIPADKTVILNTNGKTLTNKTGNYAINNLGTLTINGGGKVVRDEASNSAIRTIGTLTLENVTVQVINANMIAIKVDENGVGTKGTLVVKDGAVLDTNGGQAIQAWGDVTISGGTMNGDVTAWSVKDWNPGKIIIEGGQISGDVVAYQRVKDGNYPTAAATISIAGGTVTGNVEKACVEFTGGTIVDKSADADNFTVKGEISITGGTFSSDVDAYVAADKIVQKDGNTYKVVADGAITSGTYTSEPTVPSGYKATKNDDGTWTVTKISYYYYPSTSDTTTSTTTKGSPKTFDAGIALYVGMALTSAAGVAFVGKKRED